MTEFREESDSLGEVKVPADKLWGAQTQRSLLAPIIGYDKAAQIAHHVMDNDLTLKEAALKLGFVTEEQFDSLVDPAKMVKPFY